MLAELVTLTGDQAATVKTPVGTATVSANNSQLLTLAIAGAAAWVLFTKSGKAFIRKTFKKGRA